MKRVPGPGRNTENERPGLRYGKRVVLRSDHIAMGKTKYIALWVRCDCGRVDLVRKSSLISGAADQCRDCETLQRSEAMRGVKIGQPWARNRKPIYTGGRRESSRHLAYVLRGRQRGGITDAGQHGV